jgi:hypothetical protein
MATVVGENDWDKIESKNKNKKTRYLIPNVEDGQYTIEIIGPHVKVEQGDRDTVGRRWTKNWTKNEVEVKAWGTMHYKDEETKLNGDEMVLSLGGNKSPLLREFIYHWKQNKLSPKSIKGTRWKVERTDQWEYEIEKLEDKEPDDSEPEEKVDDVEDDEPEKEVKKEKPTKKSTSNKVIAEIVDITSELRNEPELQEGMEKEEFIAAVALRGDVSMDDIENNLKTLIRKKLIKLEDGVVLAN